MKYILLNFNNKDHKYDVVHWSHDFTDALKQYNHFKKQHRELRMFVDIEDFADASNKLVAKQILEGTYKS